MKILFLADVEAKAYWDFFHKEDFEDIDLIVSCGDLNASYLSFLATMVPVPVLYVRGNHDDRYKHNPPEGCICIEDDIYNFKGVRILGLGGCNRYKEGENQYYACAAPRQYYDKNALVYMKLEQIENEDK